MLASESIPVFNFGNHRRDFTYIDDVVEGVIRVIDQPATSNPNWNSDQPDSGSSLSPWRVYNIGNNSPVELIDYIGALENALGVKADMELLPMQSGDVPDTYADLGDFVSEFDYKPTMSVAEGVRLFVKWYREYFNV